MIYVDRVVGGLVELVQNPHCPSCLCGGCEHSVAEIVFRDNLRTRESEQYSAFLYMLESLDVQPCVPLQCIAQCSTVLCKSRRVKDDEVIFVAIFLKELEGILTESPVSGVVWEVHVHISVGQFDGFARTVDRVHDFRTATHGVEREASRVAEHVQHTFAL